MLQIHGIIHFYQIEKGGKGGEYYERVVVGGRDIALASTFCGQRKWALNSGNFSTVEKGREMLAVAGGEGAQMEKDFDSKLRIQDNSSNGGTAGGGGGGGAGSGGGGGAGTVQRSKSFAFRAPQEHFTIQDFELGKIYGVGSYSKVQPSCPVLISFFFFFPPNLFLGVFFKC